MPELAEVEFFRKRWHQAARGRRIVRVHTHDGKKLLRGIDLPALRRALTGATLESSEARAKQMLFRFSSGAQLGIHLGMSGDLTVAPASHVPRKHDHLVLFTAGDGDAAPKKPALSEANGPRSPGRGEGAAAPDASRLRPGPSRAEGHALVFADPRMFGRVLFHRGDDPPAWWTKIAPALDSPEFTFAAVAAFLRRRARAPIKAVLLMQERFPGIGNWMADEILWRAAIHPARLAGSLDQTEVRTLWRECRGVARRALATIAGPGDYLPPDLNAHIPQTWLFWHRWEDGGRCPKTKQPLRRAEIGGRTTCWSPARQTLRGSARLQPAHRTPAAIAPCAG
jgi:formamidopyrimidine-DNA glycosylase